MLVLQNTMTNGQAMHRRLFKRVTVTLAILLVLVTLVLGGVHLRNAKAAASGPGLSVDASTSYPINPNIYGACGVSMPSDAFYREIRLPLCRWGGDSTSRYNWQANATNSGVDFWFLGGSPSPNGSAGAEGFIDKNNANGATSLITVPIIPYIQKSAEQSCGFSIKKYGWDNVSGWGAFWFDWNGQGHNGHDDNYDCADGVDTSPAHNYFTGNDPHDTSIENSPAIQKAWVQHLTQKYGPSSQSHIIYQLDNEPSNWAFLHRDVHPQAVTYDELVSLAKQYAPAIKQADPTALVAGPSDIQFGWYPDWGGTANMTKYLQGMKDYEQQNGQRILDIFTVHYPDANDNHWPHLTDVDSVRKVVDETYPGTQIGFDEWNLSPDSDSTGGALATADELGIFARDRVAEAAYWTFGDAGDDSKPPAYAFRMYRNYDGQGSQFGDTYLKSTTSDDAQLSVYGARRSSDGVVTVMVINKTNNDLSSTLSLAGINPTGNAQVYNYSKTNATAIVRQGDLSVSSTGATTTFGANSITLLAIPTNGQLPNPTPPPSGGKTGAVPAGIAGKCLDVQYAHTDNGTPVQLWSCNGTNAQTWTVASDGTLQALGKCLDVSGGGTSNGTHVQLWDCNGSGAQKWVVYNNGLKNPQSDRCLDDPYASTNDGTQLQIYDCNGSDAQKWTLPS